MSIHANSLTPLTNDQIRIAAPAVFGTRPSPDRTERYQLVRTDQVLDAMRERGFAVTDAGQDNPTRRNPMHVRHMVRFSKQEALEKKAFVGDAIPQTLFWNSHNGRTKARITVGFYRFVCANGLVIGQDTNVFSFPHTGDVASQIDLGLEFANEVTNASVDKIDRWCAIELTRPQRIDFATQAMRVRFGATAGAYEPNDVLQPRRAEDDSGKLWHVFNRVQENLMNGGLAGRNANNRSVQSRRVTGITNNLGFNRALWSLAEEFAAAA